jgi:hypothetical protein
MTLCNECSYIKHNCMWEVPTQDRRVVLELPHVRVFWNCRQQKQITRPSVLTVQEQCDRQRGRFFMHRWLRDEKNANASAAISVSDTRSKCEIIPISLFLIQNIKPSYLIAEGRKYFATCDHAEWHTHIGTAVSYILVCFGTINSSPCTELRHCYFVTPMFPRPT